jgi:hypothetical protein
MLGYLPNYYVENRVMTSILQSEGMEVDDLRQALDDTLNQFFARTATWALDQWESELGLPPAPTQPDNERRDRIVSRIRGTGTATIHVVKQVAEAYDNGTIDVLEDNAAYTVMVRFVDTRGIPPNLDDLKAAVRAVVPAHLGLQYDLNYLVWDEFEALGLTWDEFEALGLSWDQFEVYV